MIDRTCYVLIPPSGSLIGQSIPIEELNFSSSLRWSIDKVLVRCQTRLNFALSIRIAEISDLTCKIFRDGKSNEFPSGSSERFQIEGVPNGDIY